MPNFSDDVLCMVTKRYHIIIDLSGVDNQILTDVKGLKIFLNKLPGVINMHTLTQPLIAEGIPENPGLTGFVIIDYSHISIHTFTNYGEALIDIFSCKAYSKESAIEATLKYSKVKRGQANVQVVSWG